MTRRRWLLTVLVAAPALAGCGRQGDLRLPDRAPPPAPTPDGAGEDDDT